MKYIAGFIITICLLIFAFVLIFRGGGDDSTDRSTAPQLVRYANTDTEVRMTIDYPVNANQIHRQVVTTVGRDQTTFTIEEGYEGQALVTQAYDNNATSYGNFLRALQLAGYNLGTDEQSLRDERGYCPEGRRYIYEIVDGTETVQRFWSTSCGNIGSFKGKSSLVNSLFVRQVPDYNRLMGSVRMC